MREINVSEVEELVRDLCIKANLYLPEDMESCIECNARKEQSPAFLYALSASQCRAVGRIRQRAGQ